MVYQRVSKFSPENFQSHKKDVASTVPQIPVQASSDSDSPQDEEMPSYTPLAADWVTNNNLMKNLSGVEAIQAKLTIGEVGDKYEQEADKIAQQVVSQINSPTSVKSASGQSLQREEMPEDEELQMKSESGIIQHQEMPEEDEEKVQMKLESGIIQRFEYNPFVTRRSLTEDLSYYDVNITEEQASPLEKIGISADIFMEYYRQGVSSEELAQLAEFALKQFPKGGQAAFEVAKYLFKIKLLLGHSQQVTNEDFLQICEFALKKDSTGGQDAFEVAKYLFKTKLLLEPGKQFTHKNLSLLYALWKKLKIEATQELVNLVVQCAADNPIRVLLYTLLKEEIALNTISIELLNHLKPFSNKLLSDTQKLRRAHTVATENPDDLAKLEEWGFDRANYEAAQSHAEALKQKHLQEGKTKIEQSEKTKQDKALKDKLGEAKVKLFPKEKDRQKAFPAQEPVLESSKKEYAKNQQRLKDKQKELAAEDFAKFAQERQVGESTLKSEAEQISTTDQEKYKLYLADINYHKEAPKVLKFAKDNFDDATKIGQAIQPVPEIIKIIDGSKLSVGALISCIDNLGVVNLGALLGQISYSALKVFADKKERLNLLRQMQADNIQLAKIEGMESQFGTFDKYCDSISIPHLCNLLQNYTIDEIQKLLSVSQKATETGKRMAFLVSIMPYASSAKDMVKFLNLATQVSDKCSTYAQLAKLWKADEIELALNHQPLGMNEKELKELIVTNVLTSINKENHFSVWIDILNILIQENLASINKSSGNDWYWLPGNTTKAIVYEVKTKDGSSVLASFVAHWHPGAVSADINNPNASKKHLKPVHGNTDTQRVYENSVPKPLAERLLWGTH